MKRFFVLAMLVFSLAFCLADCSSTARTIAHVTTVSAGSVLSQVHREHQRVYVDATDELRRSVRERHGSLAEYNTALEPIDAEFDQRSEALQNLSAALYAAASIIDASRDGTPGDWRRAAGPVLDALTRAAEMMQDGHLLGAVRMPPEVAETLRVLTTLAGGPPQHTDGGVE